MSSKFVEKLANAQNAASAYGLYISPKVEFLPPEIARYDDPFLPYMRAIFAATRDFVCAYVFDFPAYITMGGAGTVALERSISIARDTHVTVIDGRFSTGAYAAIWDDTAFAVDAVTVAEGVSLDDYQLRDDRLAFVVGQDNGKAHFSPENGLFRAEGVTLPLLPLDTLYKARSLEFRASLREAVERHAHQ